MISPQKTLAERDESDYLPARMLNEFAYCPRLFYLEHVDGLFAHNADTIEGVVKHTRVDQKTTSLPSSKRSGKSANNDDKTAADSPAVDSTIEREVVHARSVTLSSDRYGVLAKLDLVESDGTTATPVDYKRGSPKKLEEGSLGAWDPERVQLCVQALVLRENGFVCDEGVLFFWETRQRVRIAIDDELIQLTESVIDGARQLRLSAIAPPPLIDSPKCPRCSLVGICLPDETSFCRETTFGGSLMQPMLFDIGPTRMNSHRVGAVANTTSVRQMVTARDERKPLYLNSQGFSLGKSGEVLQARDKGKLVQEFRLNDVSQVIVMGNIQVTTQAIQSLMQAEVPLVYFSYGGWFHGMTQGVGLKNIMWRREQFRLDLMEPFRPLIVDSAVISAINNRMVSPEHFVSAGDAVALAPDGRKAFFRAYEQRMDQLVTHPLFDYRVSYRRILEIQTRLLARCLTGEIWDYPTFVTR